MVWCCLSLSASKFCIDRQTEMWREGDGEREREKSNSHSKTLFYKDCSLGSVKNLSNN